MTESRLATLEHAVLASWADWFRSSPRRVDWVVQRGESSTVLFVLDEAHRRPRAVVKVVRDPASNHLVRAEHGRLVEVRESVDGWAGAPEPLGLFEVDGRAALVTTFCAGVPLDRVIRRIRSRRRLLAAFGQAATWLGDLHRMTASRGIDTGGQSSSEPERSMREMLPRPLAERLLSDLSEVESGPAVLLHGDFWAGNCLRRGRRLTVVDWESSAWSPLAAIDVYGFVITAARLVGDGTQPGTAAASVHRVLTSWHRDVTPYFVARYEAARGSALGVDPLTATRVAAAEATARQLGRHTDGAAEPAFWLELVERLVGSH